MSAEVDITCRLCGLPCEQSIHIFDRLASVNMLQYKIMQLLDIAVGKSDNLPHSVCLSCVTKLDSLWCFKNMCHQVQIKLRKVRVVYEPVSSDYDRLQSEILNSDLSNSVNLKNKAQKCISSTRTNASNSSTFADLLIKEEDIDVYQHQTVSNNIGSACVSVDVEEEVQIGEKTALECNPYSEDDSDGNIEDNSISMVSEENAYRYVECSFNVDVNDYSKDTKDNMCDDSSSVLEQHDTNNGNSIESTSLEATSTAEIVQFFEGHYYRMETNINSDLLCNRIPYLINKSQMGTKHMIYTISSDVSKFDSEHDYFIDKLYIELKMFDLKNPNAGRILTEWLNNILNGEISLMPYYFGWLDKSKLNVSFKCIICKHIILKNKRFVMNHLADHLLWICPVCGKFCRTQTNLKKHMLQHLSPTFDCSTCGENLGSDIEKYTVHKRGHYKFRCPPCQFECCDEENWLKHLEKDRKNNELCSPDCSLFYESIDKFRDHVLALATLGGYVCSACGMAYHCEEYLKLHLKVHGLEHGSKTTCEESLENNDTSFKNKLDILKNSSSKKHFDVLKKILANEIDLKEFQTSSTRPGGRVTTAFICFKCCSSLQTEKRFKNHIENHLSMTCYECKKYKQGIRRLRMHFNSCFFKKRKCVSCRNEIWLNTSKEYIDHLSLHQKRKICNYCQVFIEDPKKLERHIESHKETKTWFCGICNELLVVACKSLDSFKRRHMEDKHPEKLDRCMCEICGVYFTSKVSLALHTSKKHSLRKTVDMPNFICAYCNKILYKKQSLINHIQTHMNEKRFKCAICEKCFNRLSSLDKHQKDMHSVKNHACNLCDKRFTYPSALKDHLRRAHTLCSFRMPGISSDS
ncbi:zinc finger protein 99 [Nilaparvata lugens]|uniref:zinc finger protein 99 n=1 Tax=Nilaparvata lugens TaxID=108931 RepID=UPI00193D2993|nr:zinc finger protein 99 [Nilaparvata lugens]XP_022185565.2 zinc finger protein 99 [Nilaparvata lugens]